MARARIIKPSFFDNELLGTLSPATRLLFIGLWGLADRAGRLEDRPKKIKKQLFGYDDDIGAAEVDAMLGALHRTGFILRYRVQGETYVQVTAFAKHQTPHVREAASVIPAPSSVGTEPYPDTTQALPRQCLAPTLVMPSTDPGDGELALSPVCLNLSPVCLNRLPPNPTLASPEPEPVSVPIPPIQAPPKPSRRRAATDAPDEGFAEFWTAYPRKVGKQEARKAWQKLKPDADLHAKILAAVAQQKTSDQWRKDQGQFIPHPTTWLRQGRWDDEGGVPPETVEQQREREREESFTSLLRVQEQQRIAWAERDARDKQGAEQLQRDREARARAARGGEPFSIRDLLRTEEARLRQLYPDWDPMAGKTGTPADQRPAPAPGPASTHSAGPGSGRDPPGVGPSE